MEPDAIIVQAQGPESGTIVKQAAEAGLSTNFIGEANWVESDFLDTATADCVLKGRCVPPPHPRCMTDALSSSSIGSYEKRTEA